MQQKIQLRIDISNDNINPFKVTQYDNMARALEITLINNGIAFTDYTGVTSIIVAFKKNDNKCVTQTVEIPVKGQPIIVPLKAQTLSTPGVLYGQLSLLGANQEKLGTGKFVGTVGEDLAQNAIESSNDWGDLQKAIYIAQHADEWKLNESNRKTNEDLRIQNENTRIANERERDVSFKQSQLQHENAFEASETARQNTFNNNEAERASNDVQIRNQMAELLKVTGATGTAETELLGARVDKSGKVYANICSRFDSLDSQLEDNAMQTISTDASLTKLNSVVDGNLVVDKIQGRTLVNNILTTAFIDENGYCTAIGDTTNSYKKVYCVQFKPSTDYTIIFDVLENTLEGRIRTSSGDVFPKDTIFINAKQTGRIVVKLRSNNTFPNLDNFNLVIESSASHTQANKIKFKMMLFEGEVQNPPSYFEGLKSVGEDNGNKIEISTCGKNLFDGVWEVGDIAFDTGNNTTASNNCIRFKNYIKVIPGSTITMTKVSAENTKIRLYDSNKVYIGTAGFPGVSLLTYTYKLPETVFYVRFVQEKMSDLSTLFQIEYGDNATPYEPYKEDESEISLASPLKEKDYIDKNGVHRKSRQYLLTQDSTIVLSNTNSLNTIRFRVDNVQNIFGNVNRTNIKSDKLATNANIFLDSNDEEGICTYTKHIFVRILKSKLDGWSDTLSSEQKITLIKAWLQVNPITVVYETATETIEPINESLILSSFKDGYFGLRSGAINPVVSLSFPTTIGGRVDSLEESNYQLKKDYYSTLKTLIKTADDCLKLELSKQNKTDNSLTTASKEIVGSINELNNNKVDKVNGKRLSTNDYDNVEKQEVAKVKELEKYIESLQNDIIPPSMNSNKYRYVRCSATGNSHNLNYVSYSEVKVMDGNTNIAFGCPVIDVVGAIETGVIGYITDGKSQKDDSTSCADLSTASTQLGSVTIDLGIPQSFQKIIVYHWVGNSRKYNNVKVEVSLDKSKWVTLFNSATDGGDYVEDYEGKTVEVPQNDINEVIKYNNYCTERLPDNKNNKLRVATFNMHGDNYLNFDVYKNYVTKNLLHFIGLQEVETTKGAIENKFNIYDLNKVVYGKSNTVNVYNAIHSNRSLEAPVVTNLPGTGEGRILVKSSTILNGKKVSLYVTHLSYTEASNRPLQMAKIKEIMDADTTPYKILMGDFNATANDFYNLLGTNYTSVQGYNGQWHETNLDDVYKSIDNIFITKNITINKVVLNPNMMGSDHRMLWAELTLN